MEAVEDQANGAMEEGMNAVGTPDAIGMDQRNGVWRRVAGARFVRTCWVVPRAQREQFIRSVS